MKYNSSKIFKIEEIEKPIEHCTSSSIIFNNKSTNIICFSLASKTDISKEIHYNDKLIFNLSGKLVVLEENYEYTLDKYDVLYVKKNQLVGYKSISDSIYFEFNFMEDLKMNNIDAGEIFSLKDKIPYQDEKIVSLDIISSDKLKLALMSFDKGCFLSEHAATGEALIFALDGEATITYEGKEYQIKAGENFKFDKNGKHAINATSKFKMALLLTIE